MTPPVPPSADAGPALANQRLRRRLLWLALAMFAFAFALAPLYRVFCDVVGIPRAGAAAGAYSGNTQVDTSRQVRVELLAQVEDAASWRLDPPSEARSAYPGELVQVEFELENLGDRPLIGRAVPSYAPPQAARYLRKIECFCFREQRLQPHEKRRLPVLFVLDRAIPRELGVVTLSYAFFAEAGR